MLSKSKTFIAAAFATLAIATTAIASATPAEARRWGPHWGGFGVGLASGLVVGGLVAASRPVYADTVYVSGPRRECTLVERYNRFGDYIGTRRVCRVVY
jgi:MFS-type transporter involved in bile tolerance (Atg22 family)